MMGYKDRFNVFTRFCYGAISATVLSILQNVTQTSTRMEIIAGGYHQSCMRSRNMTNEHKKRDLLREMWVTNDIHDHFLRPFVEKYF